MFTKQTIKDLDIGGKQVLLRADYNVPLNDKGEITSDYRIKQSVPTILALKEAGCKIVICSHLGRPKDSDDKSCSLAPIAKRLSELLNEEVKFISDCVGDQVSSGTASMQSGQVVLLENLRYYKEEEQNNEDFARVLAQDSHAEIFVQDGFGVVHRAHASTDAVTHFLPSVAGLLLELEVDTITNVMNDPARPLMAIIGGAKIADKIDIIYKFLDLADVVVIGGAMANTFLLATGVEVGDSLVDKDDIAIANEIIEKAKQIVTERQFTFYLPQDGVVSDKLDKTAVTRIVDWDAHVIADIESYPKRPSRSASKVGPQEKILDVGPFSGAFMAGAMQLCQTVVWNGTMGVTETESLQGPVGPFAHGTELIIDGLLGSHGHKPFSVLGGGDTTAYIEQRNLTGSFNHVSTGGGASLELMAGKSLPGVAALLDK